MIYWMTAQGLKQLQTLLQQKQAAYADVCEQRQLAFELSGDGWHDNPEFNRMQQMEANLNHQLKALSERINQVRLVEIYDGMRNLNKIDIGSIVRWARWVGDEACEEVWEIRGYDETDISTQVLGYNAPLAQAIMGLQAEDYVEELNIGGQIFDIEIVALHRSRLEAGLIIT